MEVIIIALTGFLCISCFYIGTKLGQTVSKGETVELPNLNPIKAIKESRVKKAAELEQDKLNKVLQNIERYDGTGKGQVDVG